MYYCGWDGGGTKTEVCFLRENGEMVSQSFGPLNLSGASRETVEKTVRDAVEAMRCRQEGLEGCGLLVIGMAGASNRDAAQIVEQAVRKAGYGGPLRLVGDQEIALSGAIRGHGAVLIAGTGAICYGRDPQGNSFRVGGWGYLIDDGGSGYAIGRDILMAAARAEDGRGKGTCLKQAVFDALHIQDIRGMITWLYAPGTGKKEIASLAPLLLPALEAEDEAAFTIAKKAAEDLSELVMTGWRKTGMEDGEIAMTGSILNRYAPIRALTEERIRAALPKVNIIAPRFSPAQGAAIMAREAIERLYGA
ncbi:MAG: ATPase [Clostridia bacterium]|nr:ATPase [Clostridia bacterium]MBR0228217.1 ATPase [Clostridia bacterium]